MIRKFFISTIGGYDADAQVYFTAVDTAGGTLTDDEKDRVNELVKGLKSASVWTKCSAIYPMRGDGASSMAINLSNPGTFDITFVNTVGGDFTANGWDPNGATSYARTGLVPSTTLSEDSTHISFMSNEDQAYADIDMGAWNGDQQTMWMSLEWTGTLFYGVSHRNTTGQGRITGAQTNSDYFGVLSRVAETDIRMFEDGSQIGATSTTANSGTIPSIEIYLGGRNNLGVLNNPCARQCVFSSIGDGLTPSEVSDFNTAVQAFNSDR